MSDSAGIRPTKAGITQALTDMLSRATGANGGLASGVYPLYQRLQTVRFETENASEGKAWPELNAEYRRYKTRRYGGGPRRKSKTRGAGTWNSYPGAGTKMMIGTSALAGAVIGPRPGNPFNGTAQHVALFTDTSMTISVNESGENPDGEKFEYPHHAAVHRPFMSFGDDSVHLIKGVLRTYLLGKPMENA